VSLFTAAYIKDTGGQIIGYGSSAAILGCTAVSTSVVAFGSERLPDEIYVELEPELSMGADGIPPPPPLPENTTTPTPTPTPPTTTTTTTTP
jgi:hypothetical protein